MSGMHLSYESVRDESYNQCHPDSRCYPDDSAWLRKAPIFEVWVIYLHQGPPRSDLLCHWWTWGFWQRPMLWQRWEKGTDFSLSLRGSQATVSSEVILARVTLWQFNASETRRRHLCACTDIRKMQRPWYRFSVVIFFSSSSFRLKEVHARGCYETNVTWPTRVKRINSLDIYWILVII